MSDNQFNYSGINYQGRSLHDIIKNQENIINQLKLQIQIYEKNNQEQNRKLSKHDSLLIDYNSLLKNYSQVEKELTIAKNEIIQ